jgi:O-antigen ligase
MFSIFKTTPLPIALVVLSFLCPTELSIYVADLRFPPHRIALLLLIPIALTRIVTRRDIRIRAFDIFFLLYNLWTVTIFIEHGEGASGLVYGGSLALESLGAYAIARAWIRDRAGFLASLRLLALAAFISLVFALPDALFGRHFTHDLLQNLTGYELPRKVETRLGLTRAFGTFDHPIHLGTFAATLFAMMWFATRNPALRYKRSVVVIVTTLITLSSAPILCLFTQIGLIAWDRITRGLAGRILITVAGGAGLTLIASLFSNRTPFAWIATNLTLDSWTGYYRLMIWQHGLENVWAHPWLGIGLDDWKRPWWMASSSVDAFWLVLTMRAGLPAFLLLVTAILLLLWSVAQRGGHSRDALMRRATKAWVISLIALSLVGCTVHYWNVLHAFFFFFLGIAGWIADPKPARARRKCRHMRPATNEFSWPLPSEPQPA